ncbi:MAG: large-conductance mechanosensitive channel [Bacteroidales bacterium 45-6]|nr:MAG: large-conductance mechanosensitive channel [Bacteroidales bacterium 45-6]
MSKTLSELKAFILRGNVVDLAVGVIIGGAFGKIVSSLVADVIMPPIGVLLQGVNFTDLKIVLKAATVDAKGAAVPAVSINYGSFLQTVLDFAIIASVIFFVIKGINSLKKKQEEAPAAPPTPTKEQELLTEIRDLLKNK